MVSMGYMVNLHAHTLLMLYRRSRTPSGSTPTPVNRKDRALTGEQADCSGPCTVKSSYLQWQNTKQNISSQP